MKFNLTLVYFDISYKNRWLFQTVFGFYPEAPHGPPYSIYTICSHCLNAFCTAIVFELLYGQVFPLLMMKDPENKATSPTDQNDKQNDFGESTLVNGYGSENGNENDGWTTVKSKKQGWLDFSFMGDLCE